MASLTSKNSALGSLNKELAAFLLANVGGLQMAVDGWPSSTQQLKYPAISIFPKTPKFHAESPYVVFKGAVDSVTKLAEVRKCVGMYDIEMQLDLWTAYKPQRDSMVERLIAAFNLTDVPGVNLVLTDYYNEPVHLGISSVQYMEDESAVQRNEWRAMVTVVCNLRVVTAATNYLIESIENTLETPDKITIAAVVGGGSII